MKKLFEEEWDIAKKRTYYPIKKTYSYFPVITGCPEITAERYRPFVGRMALSRQPTVMVKKAPRFAYIRKIINYPWRRMGSPQISIVGNLGTGKSKLLNLFIAFMLARGIRILMFDNSRFEARDLAPHGFYDRKNEFHEFQIKVMVPRDYKFKEGTVTNPLWKYRDNVRLIEYENADQIIDEMTPHEITVVYDDCFTEEAKLRLFSELLLIMSEIASIDKNYMFVHHELSALVPENPVKETYKLTQRVSKQIVNVRKDRIGLLTCYHMNSEVFFRVTRKFSYVCYKQPTNKNLYLPVEKDAKKLSVDEVNISRHEFWMKHKVGYYQGLPDMYRLVPQREGWDYPSLEPDGEDNGKLKAKQKMKIPELDAIDTKILRLKLKGLSYDSISEEIGMSKGGVMYRKKKIDEKLGNLQGRSVEN